MTTTAHLLSGFIGSGKTTFAKKLEKDIGAVRFTFDEWMIRIYGQNPHADDFAEYYDKVEALIWSEAADLIRAGKSIIFDAGLWSRKSRAIAHERVSAAGGVAKFYSISCPEKLMLVRTLARSRSLPDHALWIDRSAFEKLKSKFEPMEDDEEFIPVDGTLLG